MKDKKPVEKYINNNIKNYQFDVIQGELYNLIRTLNNYQRFYNTQTGSEEEAGELENITNKIVEDSTDTNIMLNTLLIELNIDYKIYKEKYIKKNI